MNIPLKHFYIAFCFVLVLSSNGLAQEKKSGEIINLNDEFTMAFTDLSSADLTVGEIVEAVVDQNVSIYLQVVETSPDLSKLGPVSKMNLPESKKDFRKLKIGNSVVTLGIASLESFHTQGTGELVLDDVIRENICLYNSYNRMVSKNKELSEYQVKLTNTLAENVSKLKVLESQKTVCAPSESTADAVVPDVCREEVDFLKEKISILKERLKFLSDLIEKNLNAYEKN